MALYVGRPSLDYHFKRKGAHRPLQYFYVHLEIMYDSRAEALAFREFTCCPAMIENQCDGNDFTLDG